MVPARQDPAIDPGFSWNSVVPRTGVVWRVTQDGKNVVKASFSRYAETMYTQVFDIINPNIIRTAGLATYQWFGDRNGNGVIDAGEYNPNPTSVFKPAANTIDPNLKTPMNTDTPSGSSASWQPTSDSPCCGSNAGSPTTTPT